MSMKAFDYKLLSISAFAFIIDEVNDFNVHTSAT